MRARSIGVGVFALLLGLVLVLLRGDPFVASDQGVFLSVAARLLEGDRLYSDVFDNKDPLFFYTYAGALFVGGWRGPFLLDAIWLAVAGISTALLARELRAPRSVIAASLLVYPLALTADWYLVGLSMLGGLAVAPLAPWLWLRGRFAGAGAVVGIVMLLKLNLAPLAAVPLAALLVLGAPAYPRARAVLRSALGLGGTLLTAAAVLGVRGELRSYLDAIVYNVHYSNARTPSDDPIGRVRDHLRIAWDFFYLAGRWQVPLVTLIVAAFVVAMCLDWMRGSRPERLFAGIAAAALLASLLVLATTTYGYEHLQLLALPATLVTGALIWRADASLGRAAGTIAATVVVLFAAWSSAMPVGATDVSALWTGRAISPGGIALERAHGRFFPDARRIPYMVLGSNSEGGHAAFTRSHFDLSCRYFHLYYFSLREQFDETLACGERESPTFVLVTLGFFEPAGDVPIWNAFVRKSRRFLESRYELVEEEFPGVQVWKRRGAP